MRRKYRLLPLVAFLLMRATSFATDPQPYLWWHGLLDVLVVLLLVGVPILDDTFTRRGR